MPNCWSIMIGLWPALTLLIRITGFAKGAGFLAEIPAKFFTYLAVASVLEYYLATSQAPFRDDMLIAADRALGVDWTAICSWSEGHPGARSLALNMPISACWPKAASWWWSPPCSIRAGQSASPRR